MAWISSSQPSDGYTIALAAGVHTGHVLLTRNGVTIQGAGRGLTTMRADGSQTALVVGLVEPPPPGGLPITSVYLRDLKLDGAAFANIVNMVGASAGGGPTLIDARRCAFVGYNGNSRALYNAGGTLHVEDCTFDGDGIAMQVADSFDSYVDDVRIRGGKGGWIVSAGTTCTGLRVNRFDCRPWYWAIPFGEALTPTAFGSNYVDVVSNVEADRTAYDVVRVLVPVGTWEVGSPTPPGRYWNRLEAADGRWTQVLGTGLDVWRGAGTFAPASTDPTGTVTVYRVVLGRLEPGGWTATRLTVANWHDVLGFATSAPTMGAGVRVDVARASVDASPRDVDVGAVHMTAATVGSRWSQVFLEGGFSDQLTFRGDDHHVDGIRVRLGQDMGITDDGGTHHYTNVVVEYQGVGAMWCSDTSRPVVRSAVLRYTQKEPGGGYGLDAPSAARPGFGRISYVRQPDTIGDVRQTMGALDRVVLHDNRRPSQVRWR